jgi:hypothetical protein
MTAQVRKHWNISYTKTMIHQLSCGNQKFPRWWQSLAGTYGGKKRQITHDEKMKEPAQSAIAIGVLYSNYTASNSARPKLRKAGWAKPLKDFVKLNVDASFDADDLRGATGVVIHDCNGLFYRQKYMLLSRG